mmetsp:Transcript_5361/g.8814  ORF Transcript_5361/g.8814 Transcript_5361/m.8814 type:complete len:277 (-) Transcript_5361:4806-5636(-)
MTGLSSKRFIYTGEKKDGKGKFQKYVDFECTLKSQQCRGITKKDKQCPRETVMGTNLCWQHLITVKFVRIKKIRGSKEKGVFAMLSDSKKWLKSGKPARIVFQKNEKIIRFRGEVLNNEQQKERYKRRDGPYLWYVEDNNYIDAACDRSAGSFVRPSDTGNANFKEIKGKIWFIANKDIKEGEEILGRYRLQSNPVPGSKWYAPNDQDDYRFKYKTTTARRKKKDRKGNKKAEKVKKKQRVSGKFKNVTVRKNNKRTARQQRILDRKKKRKKSRQR